MIGDPVIIAQTMTALGIMTALLATDGSRCGAGAAVRCLRFGSIKAENTAIVIPATASFLRRFLMVIHRCDRCGNRMVIWFTVDVGVRAVNDSVNAVGMMPYKGLYQFCLDCWSAFVNVP